MAKKKEKVCKICKKFLKESRWVYCSPECLKKSKEENKHWTNKVPGKGWRDYRKFDIRRTNPSNWAQYD